MLQVSHCETMASDGDCNDNKLDDEIVENREQICESAVASDGECNDNSLHGEIVGNGEQMCESARARETLTRIELDLAYSSEKVLNLSMLMMHVASRVTDREAPLLDDDVSFIDSLGKTFEIDMLSGFLSSEVQEIDGFMKYFGEEISDACPNIYFSTKTDISLREVADKLHDAEEAFKQLQDQVSEIKMQLPKFERILSFGLESCGSSNSFRFLVIDFVNQHFFSNTSRLTGSGSAEGSSENDLVLMDDHWRTPSINQQRHTLQMLEKSLAGELDLEKKLSDSKHNEEEIRLKLHYAENEKYRIEETMVSILGRLFEAENSTEIFTGISKELISKIQKMNYLKTSLQEVKGKNVDANSEVLSLMEKVASLEQQVAESSVQLQQTKESFGVCQEHQNISTSELTDKANMILALKENICKAENKVKSAEARYILLAEANSELSKELSFMKGDGAKKATFLEKKLEESDVQLENAKASVEAIEEQQNLLYSALGDMEHLIKDLKTKLSKAEKKAECADTKCNLLTETNLELTEEISFLRSKLESLEKSLRRANDTKRTSAKDIHVRTKMITDLVMKLAMERERLQIQISSLKKENIMLEESWRTKDDHHSFKSHTSDESGKSIFFHKSHEDSVTQTFLTNFQMENLAAKSPVRETQEEKSLKDASAVEPRTAPVRNIEASQLSLKHVLFAGLILLVSILAMYLLQLD